MYIQMTYIQCTFSCAKSATNINAVHSYNKLNLYKKIYRFVGLWISVGLWNCQSAVNKADFISAFSLQSTLSILGLTETWIRPEDSATPGCSLSPISLFSHTPRQVAGWGTSLLISNNWKYSTHSPLGNHNSFESHAITVMAPINSR